MRSTRERVLLPPLPVVVCITPQITSKIVGKRPALLRRKILLVSNPRAEGNRSSSVETV